MANNLSFTLQNGLYVATKTVNSNFAVHLESNIEGNFTILQCSDPDATKYEATDTFVRRSVVDAQYNGYVFPVKIKISSTVPVSYGSITEE